MGAKTTPVRFCLLIFNLLLLNPSADAQGSGYTFRQFNITNGLVTNDVSCLYRDTSGFLWIGTTSGLYRYDGFTNKSFTTEDPHTYLGNDAITSIWAFPGGKLFVATVEDAYLYDPRSETFSPAAPELKSWGLPTESPLWIGRGSGGFFFVYPHQAFYRGDRETKTIPQYLGGRMVSDARAEDGSPLSVLYTDGRVAVFEGPSGHATDSSTGFVPFIRNTSTHLRLFIDRNGDRWLYKPDDQFGVLHEERGSGKVQLLTRDNKGLDNDIVNGIVDDPAGNIWIMTDHGGVNILDKHRPGITCLFHDESDPASLAQNEVRSVYKDFSGNIWINTYKKGLSIYLPNYYQFFPYRPSAGQGASAGQTGAAPFDDILRVAQDRRGNLWLGTNGGGLLYYDVCKKTYRSFRHDEHDPNTIGGDVVVSLYVDADNKLWIGYYYGGMDCYDGHTFRHFPYNAAHQSSIGDNSIWEIYEDSQQRIWIGTLKNGLNVFDRKTNQFYRYPPQKGSGFNSSYVTSFTEDGVGNIWIGSSLGIYILKRGSAFFEFVNDSTPDFPPQVVVSMVRDDRGDIWIGTQRGLFVYNQRAGKYQRFTMADGLPDNFIAKVLQDHDHDIWVSTHKGFARLKVSREPDRISITVRKYDTHDGMQSAWFNDNAGMVTREGDVVFGGDKGFNLFHPGDIPLDTERVHIVFNALYLFDTVVRPGQPIHGRVLLPQALSASSALTLRYDENSFAVEFSAADFGNVQGIRWSYKLDGFDPNWMTTVDRRASYTNLSPGHYTLRVRAINADGFRSRQDRTLSVTVLPPFWRTPLAYVLYAIILVLILYGARRQVLRRAATRFAIEGERREAQRVNELHLMKLRFFTNISHEIKTPLALILSPMESLIASNTDPGSAKHYSIINRNARRLLQLVNQLLDFRTLEVQELNERRTKRPLFTFLRETVQDFTDLSEKQHIRFDLSIPNTRVAADCDYEKLERILFNLLSNALKFTPEMGTVSVTAGLDDNLLVIEIRDTGIGMDGQECAQIWDRFYQGTVPTGVLNTGTGIGLSIVREFVQIMQGEITVSSKRNKGTVFSLTLPVYEVSIAEDPVPDVKPVPVRIAPVPEGGTILVVEDNDDFRSYLMDHLSQWYNVLEAENGKKGWQRILSEHPDLVISDISMPVMNGFQLCRKIKTDPRTAGIPVILLTAFSGEETQIEGLDAGATDYMHKPFNVDLLTTRVRNILHEQQLLKDKYSKQVKAFSSEVDDDKANEKFIQQVLEHIERNITNPNFSVSELSRLVYLSRVHLYRKVFAITGKTPMEFIRAIRLQRAEKLLTKTRMTVVEVAYDTGFNNPKVLSRYFREQYGELPSDYAKRHRGNA